MDIINKILWLFLPLLLSHSAWSQKREEQQVQIAVGRFYAVLSFSDTNSIQIDSLNSLFIPGAKLIANFGKQPVSWTVPEYISAVKQNIHVQEIKSIIEKELSQKTDLFGKIAQVFSTYEITIESKTATIKRKGINAIQLIRQNGNWYIVSVVWDRENDDLKIPAQYLMNSALH